MTDTTTAPASPANGAPRRRHRDPRTGRYTLSPAEAEARAARLAGLHAEIEQAAHEGRVPPSVAALWRQELGIVVDALQAMTSSLAPTTAAGRVSRQYRDYVVLVERVATLARWLGLHAGEAGAGKRKPWAKLTREQQELEAQRAFDQIENDLRGSRGRDEDDGDE